MSSSVGFSGRFGLVPLFSMLVILLSLLNLSGAAPVPAPGDTTVGTQFGQFFSVDLTFGEAMKSFENLAKTPDEFAQALAEFEDEMTKAFASKDSMFTDPDFGFITNYEAHLNGLKQMSIEQKPTDPGMAGPMLGLFGGDSIDSTSKPAGIVYDAAGADGNVPVSDDANSVKKANPGFADRFALFGKSKQLVRWIIASMKAVKARADKAKAANQPLSHADQLSSIKDIVAATAQAQDMATTSYADDKDFVILNDDAGANYYKQNTKSLFSRMASVRSTFRPSVLPKGQTKVKFAITLSITTNSDPANHMTNEPVSPLSPTDPNAAVPADPNATHDPVSPIEQTDPNAPTEPSTDPNAPVDPNAPEDPNKPSTTKGPTNKPPVGATHPPKA